MISIGCGTCLCPQAQIFRCMGSCNIQYLILLHISVHVQPSTGLGSIACLRKATPRSLQAHDLTPYILHVSNDKRPFYLGMTRQSKRPSPFALYGQPTENLVSSPVTGFCPFNVGFLHKLRKSKSPMAASVKSAPSTSASSKVVPVKTAFLKMAPRTLDPLKLARSTIALVKSAPSNLLSVPR